MDFKMCDECGLNPANVHLTQISGQQTLMCHLCEHCARKKGIDITAATDGTGSGEPAKPEKETECPTCHLKYSEFKKRGRLGCAGCYGVFSKEINEILLQTHGSYTHKGKRPIAAAVEAVDIQRLRDELQSAIHLEKFELAAQLRDKIHGIEKA